MSSFTTPAILQLLDHYKWRVFTPFSFYKGTKENREYTIVFMKECQFQEYLNGKPKYFIQVLSFLEKEIIKILLGREYEKIHPRRSYNRVSVWY